MTDKWEKINIRKETLNRVRKFIKTKKGMKMGFTNPTQFLDDCIRRRLEEVRMQRFERYNLHDNVIRVLDNDIDPLGEFVEIFLKDNKLGCGYCGITDCIHIKYVWTQPDLMAELRKKGLKPPT